jgi:hypothetical protein
MNAPLRALSLFGRGLFFFVIFSGFAAPASALVILSEIFYDAEGSDDGHVFVELAGPPGTLLDGWQVEGVNGFNGAVGPVIVLSGSIPASGLFVLADRTGGGSVFVENADLVANFDFQNGPDSIVLRDAFGIVDAVGYGSFTSAQFFAGEGSPASDPPGGSSVARWFADVDSDDNAADFRVLGEPTPGTADFLVVPEPGSGVLLGTALLALGGLRQGTRGFRRHGQPRPEAAHRQDLPGPKQACDRDIGILRGSEPSRRAEVSR